MSKTKTIKAKELNKFEHIGLLHFMGAEMLYDLDSIVLGTSKNNLINLDNVRIAYLEDRGVKKGQLGSIGLTEGNDVIFEFWEGEKCSSFVVEFSEIRNGFPMYWNFNQVNIEK